jgi:large subunit ribosomal protein L24
MKLRKDDKVIVISGRDKGKTGIIERVLPSEGKVIVGGINMYKRHTKPSSKEPRGGILDITKPIDVSKVMIIDPVTSKPSRIYYNFVKDGSKERLFKEKHE